MVKNIDSLKYFLIKNKIYLILIIIFLLVIIYSFINYLPYWDEGVYISNGKYLFSGTEISTYEFQRPPLMGVLTGIFWYLGANEILFSKIALTIIFILGLFYLYKISEDIKKGSGVITTILYASLPTIALFTNRILTEIPGTALSIIGYYFFTKRKYFLSGFILSLAFLFRYPTGIVFGILGVFLIIELLKYLKIKQLKNIFYYGAGFSILVVPFIIINYILIGVKYLEVSLLHKILLPFINASKMVAANAFDLVTNGYWYYIKYLFFESFLLVFFILLIIGIVIYKNIKKDVLKKELSLTIIISILSFIYVANLVHYEPRYFIIGLPFFAIISGYVIIELFKKIRLEKKIFIIEIILIVILLITYLIFIKAQIIINNNTDYEKINNYYTYVSKIDLDYKGFIGIDNPTFGIYNEKNKMIYLAGPIYAEYVITEINKEKTFKYLLFEKENFVCWREGDINCIENLDDFNNLLLEKYELIYLEEFLQGTHVIYKLK